MQPVDVALVLVQPESNPEHVAADVGDAVSRLERAYQSWPAGRGRRGSGRAAAVERVQSSAAPSGVGTNASSSWPWSVAAWSATAAVVRRFS